MGKVGIYYDQSNDGLLSIMASHKMKKLEYEIMMQKKSEVEAAFLQRFGVPGAFKFSVLVSDNPKYWNKSWHSGRIIYRIMPDNSADRGRTYAILKAHPGWINQFID